MSLADRIRDRISQYSEGAEKARRVAEEHVHEEGQTWEYTTGVADMARQVVEDLIYDLEADGIDSRPDHAREADHSDRDNS